MELIISKMCQLQRGKTLTVNICMASIRSGLIKYGKGTPIYEQLRKNGNLKQALSLNGEDNQKFQEYICIAKLGTEI